MMRKTQSKKFSLSDRCHLEKKIKSNPRYHGIGPKIYTGPNVTIKYHIENEIKKYYKVRSSETFQRVTLTELLQLIVVYTSDCELLGNENINGESTLQSNLTGLEKSYSTKLDLMGISVGQKELECPFLLLDVRSSECFEDGHLMSAVSYPHQRLSRAVGWETRKMLGYKNRPGSIVIVYDEDETLGPESATVLVHRGYENVFLLSGGMKLVRDKIGPPLIVAGNGEGLSPAIGDFLQNNFSCLRMVDSLYRCRSSLCLLEGDEDKIEKTNQRF